MGTFSMGLVAAVMTAMLSLDAAASPVDDAFAALRALSGAWEVNEDGKTFTVTFSEESRGGSVLEKNATFITVYYRDRDTLMATLFGSHGSQPRFRAKGLSSDGKLLAFELVDATNADPSQGAISGLVLEFFGDSRVVEHWKWRENGVEKAFDIELKRPMSGNP